MQQKKYPKKCSKNRWGPTTSLYLLWVDMTYSNLHCIWQLHPNLLILFRDPVLLIRFKHPGEVAPGLVLYTSASYFFHGLITCTSHRVWGPKNQLWVAIRDPLMPFIFSAMYIFPITPWRFHNDRLLEVVLSGFLPSELPRLGGVPPTTPVTLTSSGTRRAQRRVGDIFEGEVLENCQTHWCLEHTHPLDLEKVHGFFSIISSSIFDSCW